MYLDKLIVHFGFKRLQTIIYLEPLHVTFSSRSRAVALKLFLQCASLYF